MTPKDPDVDSPAVVVTLLSFLGGVLSCGIQFGWEMGVIVLLLGFALIGELQRLANKIIVTLDSKE